MKKAMGRQKNKWKLRRRKKRYASEKGNDNESNRREGGCSGVWLEEL